MNDFSDAFQRGQQARQKLIEDEKASQAAIAAKVRQSIQAAKAWLEDCVDPVVADAKEGLADKGTISIKDTSRAPSNGREIVFEMTGKKPYKVAFTVRPDGAVLAFRKDGEPEQFGNINNSFVDKVRNYLLQIVNEIGES